MTFTEPNVQAAHQSLIKAVELATMDEPDDVGVQKAYTKAKKEVKLLV